MSKRALRSALAVLALVVGGGVIGGLIVFAATQQKPFPIGLMPSDAEQLLANPPDPNRIPPPMPTPPPAQANADPTNHASDLQGWDAKTVGFPGRQLEYTQSHSGYRIAVGRRAVDYEDPNQTRALPPGTIDPGATAGWAADNETVSPQRIGRNGLVSNPPVDPPSSHGYAYSRSY